MLVKLLKNLLLDGIPTSVITLPYRMNNYTAKDVEKFSKSKGLMMFTMSDTDVLHDYLRKVCWFTIFNTNSNSSFICT
jgi:hypothetical protein